MCLELERQVDIGSGSISHEFKLAVRGDEGDRTVGIEFT
jgi:hypothetical protein